MTETQTDQGIVFNMEKVYVKDVSFESPMAPQAFFENQAPEVGLQLGIEHTTIDAAQGLYEGMLALTVTAKRADKTIFLVEIKQAGIFRIQGLDEETMKKALMIACPTALLPFAREAVNDFVGKGGFPQLLLAPINFELLYEHRQQSMTGQTQVGHA